MKVEDRGRPGSQKQRQHEKDGPNAAAGGDGGEGLRTKDCGQPLAAAQGRQQTLLEPQEGNAGLSRP